MTRSMDGGCQCGALRYRIEGEPVALAVCHCSECQRGSGSAFGMSLVVPRGAFRMLAGEPKIWTRSSDSGRAVRCAFCAECGVRIYHQPERMPDTLNVKPGTLDDRSWLAPSAHVWLRSKQPWVPIPDGVRRVDGQPG
jgi:hypothetical protein